MSAALPWAVSRRCVMHTKLEDILNEKDSGLKLGEKFAGLERLLGEEVFAHAPLPLREHVESLKHLVEQLIPSCDDGRSRFFPEELFVLLCVLYLHDMGVVDWCGRSSNREMLRVLDRASRTLLLNGEIAERVGVPAKTMELVNSLIMGLKKIPLEWEIATEAGKGIIRNGPLLGALFDFAHLLWDICSLDWSQRALKREDNRDLNPACEAAVSIDSRAGVIVVACEPRSDYQVRVLGRVREHLERRFERFLNAVNGRLGFQYRQIVWEIAECAERRYPPEGAERFLFQGPPHNRWDEASRLLDVLFRHGHVIVVGDNAAGKTTLVNAFVLPQLRSVSANVFYAEIWEKPVHEIREAVAKAGVIPPGARVDIVSICRKLLKSGPCFFIIDGAERLKTVRSEEREKLERFATFCLEQENAYLAVLGDKEEFFSWRQPFRKMSLSAVFEAGPVERTNIAPLSLQEEALPREIVNEKVEEALAGAGNRDELREIVSVLAGDNGKMLTRRTLEDIRFDTRIPKERIASCLDLLQEKGIVRQHETSGRTFWTLSSRYLRERLHRRLGLDEFLPKREIREALRRAGEEGSFLDPERLDMIESLRDGMAFTRKEVGVIVASMLFHERNWASFLDRADGETPGFDGEPVLPLLARGEFEIREAAIRLLVRARDDSLTNSLLAHLKRETSPELRALLTESVIAGGKRRSIAALMNALVEMGDRDARIRAIDSAFRLPASAAHELLLEAAVVEKDPEVIDRIDYWLAQLDA